MKSIIRTTGVFLVALVFVTLGCQEQSREPGFSKLERSEEVARLNGGQFFNERVTFTKSETGNLVGVFDTRQAQKTITLQVEPGAALTVPQSGQYEILYLNHALILNSVSTGKRYLLAVSNPLADKVIHDLPASYADGTTTLKGFGLSLSNSQKES
ncbi:hypothetical protein GCM10027578_03250 [Spirosoma luteolum]